jgi:hypothetical protein
MTIEAYPDVALTPSLQLRKFFVSKVYVVSYMCCAASCICKHFKITNKSMPATLPL